MSKPNHNSLAYKRQAAPDKTYKQLKQKQKLRIAEMMYRETLRFYLQNQRMPDDAEIDELCRKIHSKIEALAIWVPYDEVLREYHRKLGRYETRIRADIENGVTEQSLEKPKKPKKDKGKKPHQRKKKKKSVDEPIVDFQDDHFFFIAGYTSGGAPYGVTWEEMGLRPWQSIDDSDGDEDDEE